MRASAAHPGAGARPGSLLRIGYGVFAGIYLLYTIGWFVAVLRNSLTLAGLVPEIMYQLGEFLAIVGARCLARSRRRADPRAAAVARGCSGSRSAFPCSFRGRFSWEVTPVAARSTVAIAALFALLYGYDLFEAVSDTIGVTSQIAAFNANAVSVGLQPVAVPWVVLVASLALPPVSTRSPSRLGRRLSTRRPRSRLHGRPGVVAALTLSLTTFAGAPGRMTAHPVTGRHRAGAPSALH